MDSSKFRNFVSPPRLNRYIEVSGGVADAKRLYEDNVLLSQAFYPILSHYEVFLRNTTCDGFATYFNDKNWILTESKHSGFLTKSPKGTKPPAEKIKAVLLTHGQFVPAGKVISEMTMGFWVGLFRNDYHGDSAGVITEKCFPHRPPKIKRKHLYNRMEAIRILRNRVFHNEPIIFDNKGVSFNEIRKVRSYIFSLLRWIDPELEAYVLQFDTIQDAIKQCVGEK